MAMKSKFGSVLSEWRALRHLSQLDLASLTGISQRHISFLESGRAQPSRDIIFKLVDGLDLPLRARNDIFLAGGYAPVYPERRLDLAEMKAARSALELVLGHHEPYPAIVMDASWNIIMQNAAASRIIAFCLGADAVRQFSATGPFNFMQLMFADNGLRPHIGNWRHARATLLARLRREAAGSPGSPSETLRRQFEEDTPAPGNATALNDEFEPVLPLELTVGDMQLRLFNTFTTFGTPQDVLLQELRIDMSFPADEMTRKFLNSASKVGIEATLTQQAGLRARARTARRV